MNREQRNSLRRAFFERCKRHDWFYPMSDDPSVYRAGLEVRRELEWQVQQAPEVLEPIWAAWLDMVREAYEGEARPSPRLEDFLEEESDDADA